MCEPLTSKIGVSPRISVTVPTEFGEPSPQSIVASKSESGAVGLPSLKAPTTPVKIGTPNWGTG